MIKCAIIGYGKMGQIRAEAINKHPDAEVITLYDPAVITDSHGSNVVDSPDEIIADPELDAVFICTPNYLNRPLTIQALNAGKHVFCEKPPAFAADEVMEIRSVEAATGLKLMYGFNHRHHGSIIKMKEIIESGEFGKILWLRGRYGKSVENSFFETWRSQKELAGGGILLDQGIHMLDLFLHLYGTFDEVKAFVSNLYWQSEIEDNVFAILKNSQTGVVASLHSTMTQWRHLFSLEIFLERGHIVLNGLKTSSGTYGDEQLSISRNRSAGPAASWVDEERITYHTDKSWYLEISHFFDAIISDQIIETGNSQDALDLMTILDMIYADSKLN